MPGLPLLVRASMWMLLNHTDRRSVLSDLEELYEHRRAVDGEAAAGAWLRRQAWTYPYQLLANRMRKHKTAHCSLLTAHCSLRTLLGTSRLTTHDSRLTLLPPNTYEPWPAISATVSAA